MSRLALVCIGRSDSIGTGMLMSHRDELTVRGVGRVRRRGKVENCFKAAGTSTGCECEIAWNKIEAVVPDGHVSPQRCC